MGPVPGAFEGGELALDAGQEFGVGEAGSGVFGKDGAIEFGFDDLEAALLPVATDQGIDVESLLGGGGRKSAS